VLAGGMWGLAQSRGESRAAEVILVAAGAEEAVMAGLPGQDATPAPSAPASAPSAGAAVPSSETAVPWAATPTSGETVASGDIFVQVAGAVRRPGVVRMPPGARVFEALRAVGGAQEDADEHALPLAAMLADGMRVYVPRQGEEGEVSGPGAAAVTGGHIALGGSTEAGHEKVSLTHASEAELQTLPGIGPAMAARIIAFREDHGPFISVEELDDVPGVGPATMERLRPLVSP
jgi:competence protein ComEA